MRQLQSSDGNCLLSRYVGGVLCGSWKRVKLLAPDGMHIMYSFVPLQPCVHQECAQHMLVQPCGCAQSESEYRGWWGYLWFLLYMPFLIHHPVPRPRLSAWKQNFVGIDHHQYDEEMLPRLEDTDCCLEEILDGSITREGTHNGVVINITNEVLQEVNDVRYICKLEARWEGW